MNQHSDELRALVLDELELPQSSSDGDLRRCLVAGLSDRPQLSFATFELATCLLSGREPRVAAVNAVREQKLRTGIAEFSRAFFELPLQERQNEYQRLNSNCVQFPHLAQRLEHLQRGLKIDATLTSNLDEESMSLAETLTKPFLLSATDYPSYCLELLLEPKRDAGPSRQCIERFQQECPRIADLIPTLFTQLTDHASGRKYIAQQLQQRDSRLQQWHTQLAYEQNEASQINSWFLVLLFILGMALFVKFNEESTVSTLKLSDSRPIDLNVRRQHSTNNQGNLPSADELAALILRSRVQWLNGRVGVGQGTQQISQHELRQLMQSPELREKVRQLIFDSSQEGGPPDADSEEWAESSKEPAVVLAILEHLKTLRSSPDKVSRPSVARAAMTSLIPEWINIVTRAQLVRRLEAQAYGKTVRILGLKELQSSPTQEINRLLPGSLPFIKATFPGNSDDPTFESALDTVHAFVVRLDARREQSAAFGDETLQAISELKELTMQVNEEAIEPEPTGQPSSAPLVTDAPKAESQVNE